MCVIAYFEKDRELNKAELVNCFAQNPDGAGLMYYDDKKRMVHIKKGFMTFEEFWKEAEKLPVDVDRVFHFRIATSGKISGACCHPFPVTNSYEKMSRIDTYADLAMVHNGVMYDFTPTGGMKAKHSDTMQFIKNIVYPLRHQIDNPALQYLWEEAMNTNKYILLNKEGAILIGNFQQSKTSGAMYSNTSYLGYRFGTTKLNNPWVPTITTKATDIEHFDDCCGAYGEWDDMYGEDGFLYTLTIDLGPINDEKIREDIETRISDELLQYGAYVETFEYDNGVAVVDVWMENNAYITGIPQRICGYSWGWATYE